MSNMYAKYFESTTAFEEDHELEDVGLGEIKREGLPPVICYKRKKSGRDIMSMHVRSDKEFVADRILRYNDRTVLRFDDGTLALADTNK